MSYILDALKRADTERERERGNVPGLHSQNLPGGTMQRGRQGKAPVRNHRTIVIGAMLGVALLAFAWWRLNTETPSPPMATQPAPQVVTAPEPAKSPPEPPPSAAAMARAPELPILAPAPPQASPPPPPPVRAVKAPTPATNGVPATATAAPAANAAAAAPPERTAATTAPTSASAPAGAPVRRFAELPADFRAQLPQVNINGSTYSSNPAQRTLIANGKMVQEGDEIAPGLKLETIGQRSAVLNFQGTRYSIGY
jgi:general secretion pathway protein B